MQGGKFEMSNFDLYFCILVGGVFGVFWGHVRTCGWYLYFAFSFGAVALLDMRRMLLVCVTSCCFGSRLGCSSPVDCHLVDFGGPPVRHVAIR